MQGSDQAAPSCAVAFHGVPVETASTSCHPLAGVPHHKAVCYQVALPVSQGPEVAMPFSCSPLRVRRCAAYVWLKRPSPVQAQQLQQTEKHKNQNSTTLRTRLLNSCASAESVLHHMVLQSLARCQCRSCALPIRYLCCRRSAKQEQAHPSFASLHRCPSIGICHFCRYQKRGFKTRKS